MSVQQELPTPKHWKLEGKSLLDYEPHWLASDRAARLFDAMCAELVWEEREIVVFGRAILQPRLVAWAGELPYRYSGQTLEPRAAPPVLAELLDEVRQRVGAPFNHVLGNLYRNGHDHMAMHADNEPELGRCPVIASVNLGAPRRFVVERKRDRHKRRLTLHPGSLLVMGGAFQHRYRHGVPKQRTNEAARVNLTFRWLGGPPGWRQPPDPDEPARHRRGGRR